MSILSQALVPVFEAILATETNIATKLATVKVASQLLGSSQAKTIAASDPTISAYAAQIVDGLNGNIITAVTAAEGVYGASTGQVISTAVTAIEAQATALLEKAGVNASVADLLVLLEDSTITAEVTSDLNKLSGTTTATTATS
jgi:D-alanyl-D-alanine carboxypeptidase